jgi:cytochrome b561
VTQEASTLQLDRGVRGLFNSRERYGLVAIAFHWAFVIAIPVQFVIYLFMHNLPVSDTKWWFYDLHKSVGLTLFLAVLCRLGWRLLNPAPELPGTMPRWQQCAAKLSHGYLYLAMIGLPISGYIGSKAGGFKASWWGIYETPDLFGKNEALNYWAELVHAVAFYSLAAVVCLHVAAALSHHFKWRDLVLRRMLP